MAACCQLMAILAVTGSAAVKIWAAFQASSSSLTDPHTFNEITNHPACFIILMIFNIFWFSTVIMLILGVANFNPHLMRPHIAVQLISLITCTLLAVTTSVQLAIGVTDNARNGPVEEIITLVSCGVVILVQAWSIPVVHECMEYFQMCQVLLDLAKGKRGVGDQGQISVISNTV